MGDDFNKYSALIIISAARSGSKILRQVIGTSKEFSVCQYDANYVWRCGNYSVPHDELQYSSLSLADIKKIRGFFGNVCERGESPRLLEKTVSNSLRVPLVRSVFPDAKIIHLYRDGHAAVGSALACWRDDATSDRIQSWEDRFQKLREFPFLMAWPYLLGYAKVYGKKKLLFMDHVESWGPRYEGIEEDVKNRSLEDVCSIQWARCVERSVEALKGLESGKDYLNISYEDLLKDPGNQIDRIADFADIQNRNDMKAYASKVIDPDRGKAGRYEGVPFSREAEQAIMNAKASLRELTEEGRVDEGG